MQIAGLLGDQYPAVRIACVNLLCSPKGYGKTMLLVPSSRLILFSGILASKIRDMISRVTELLMDVDGGVRSATAKALVPLCQDGECYTPLFAITYTGF
jgi:hypothetical protein